MQAPAHSCWPVGQVVPQATPSQVAMPPVGMAQAVQEVGPQFAASLLSTHLVPHLWKPALHIKVHAPA
jgi:hypothetical protein